MSTLARTAVIDSDAHVIETERTWEYLREEDETHRPLVLTRKDEATDQQFWFLEGRAWGKNVNQGDEFPTAAREAADIKARLRHMDELGVDMHVLFPTMFLRPLTRYANTDYALSRAYNRWLGDIWAEGEGRLRWAVIPPLMSMDKAIEELHFGKEHGACAVFLRGIEGDLLLSDPSLFPIYEEAQKLDLAIAVHAAAGNFERLDREQRSFGLTTFKFPTVGAFSDLVLHRVPERFPDLRWTFVEVTSQWLPYVLNDIGLRSKRLAGHPFPEGRDLLREYQMYVACQTVDDLGYVVDRVGDDNLIIGTDYGHRDTTAEIDALRKLRDDGKVGEATATKILSTNPKRLYGL
jgi:predicted TIM-barrel fold metal-dependent hydrolase